VNNFSPSGIKDMRSSSLGGINNGVEILKKDLVNSHYVIGDQDRSLKNACSTTKDAFL
jgi:hypothetical protein